MAVSRELQSVGFVVPDDPVIESLGVKVWMNNIEISFVNIYSPTGQLMENSLNNLIKDLNAPHLITGDFNINLLKKSKQEGMLKNWVNNNQLCIGTDYYYFCFLVEWQHIIIKW